MVSFAYAIDAYVYHFSDLITKGIVRCISRCLCYGKSKKEKDYDQFKSSKVPKPKKHKTIQLEGGSKIKTIDEM